MGFGLRGQDAWRAHPVIANCHKGAFPGLKTAGILVGLYIAGDQLLNLMNSEYVYVPFASAVAIYFVTVGLVLWVVLRDEEMKIITYRRCKTG